MKAILSVWVAVVLAGAAAAQDYTRIWQSPNLGSNAWGGTNGFDVDGSGYPNLWLRKDGQVVIYDAGLNPWWTFNCPGYQYPMLVIPRDIDGDGLVRPVDINGDGTGEVVFSGYRIDGSNFYGRFWIYDAVTRGLEWESPEIPGFNGYVQLDDIDGDGRYEIIISRYDYQSNWGYVEVYGYVGTGLDERPVYGRKSQPTRVRPSISRAALEIGYELETGGPVRLRVFDAAGREVRELLNAELPPGRYSARWDGRDRSGRELPAGSYFYRLEAAERAEEGRLTLVR